MSRFRAAPIAVAGYGDAEPWRDSVLWPFRLDVSSQLWPRVAAVLPPSHALAYRDFDCDYNVIALRPWHVVVRLWHRRWMAMLGPLWLLGVWGRGVEGSELRSGGWQWPPAPPRRITFRSWRSYWRAVWLP